MSLDCSRIRFISYQTKHVLENEKSKEPPPMGFIQSSLDVMHVCNQKILFIELNETKYINLNSLLLIKMIFKSLTQSSL